MATVNELAEQYRVTLGLRPWEEQKQWANNKREKMALTPEAYEAWKDRQSGRTTKGLLLAIARAVHVGARVLIVEGHGAQHEDVLVIRARGMVADLGLSLEVQGYLRSKTAHYTDHLVWEMGD
jgi:hypothetical protein